MALIIGSLSLFYRTYVSINIVIKTNKYELIIGIKLALQKKYFIIVLNKKHIASVLKI